MRLVAVGAASRIADVNSVIKLYCVIDTTHVIVLGLICLVMSHYMVPVGVRATGPLARYVLSYGKQLI